MPPALRLARKRTAKALHEDPAPTNVAPVRKRAGTQPRKQLVKRNHRQTTSNRSLNNAEDAIDAAMQLLQLKKFAVAR